MNNTNYKPKKELLLTLTKKDFVVEWFSGSGAGGQHRNKTKNCCRIKHLASGATGIGTEQRSREQNKKKAFRRLTSRQCFVSWLRVESCRKNQEINNIKKIEMEIEQWLNQQMAPENLTVEYF